MNRNSSMIRRIVIIVLLSLSIVYISYAMNGFESYADSSDTRKVYFDNYYTQFDEVYICASLDTYYDDEVIKMEDFENGFLVAEVPNKYEYYRIEKVVGGYTQYPDRVINYNDYIGGSPYHKVLDDNMATLSYNGTISWSTYDGTRTAVEKEYTDSQYTIANQPSFNEPESNVTDLQIDEVPVTADYNSGEGWYYKDNILYIGEDAPFKGSILSTGELTVIVKGSNNEFYRLNASESLTLSIMSGIVNLTGYAFAGNLNLNVSSYGTLNIDGDYAYFFGITDAIINTKCNGKINFNYEPLDEHSYYDTYPYLQCNTLTINGDGTREINCIFNQFPYAAGPLQVEKECTLNNVIIASFSSLGTGHSIVCNGRTTNNNSICDDDNYRAHCFHYAGNWEHAQDFSPADKNNGIDIKRCLICGQLIDIKTNYYSDYYIDYKDIQIPESEYVCTGEPICPKVTIEGLEENNDYEVEYIDNVNEGQAKIIVTGCGDYYGSKELTFDIIRHPIDEEQISGVDNEYDYTGEPICPEVSILGLTEGKDYKVDYEDNTEEGTAKVIVTGLVAYKGTVEIPFEIVRHPIDEEQISGVDNEYDYTGEPICPEVSILGLTKGKDYTVDYENNTEEGTAKVIITGLVAYKGTKEISFNIVRHPIDKEQVSGVDNEYDYTGEPICPEVSISGLTKGKDYKVDYEDNTEEGTAKVIITGLVAYKGTKEISFNIVRHPISELDATISENTYVYSGEPICPEVTIPGLTEGIDYSVEYLNNVEQGKATIVITGLVAYKGIIEKTFTIIGNGTYINYGACGEDCVWTMTGNYALTISGNGDIPDYTNGAADAPWAEYCEKITSIEIGAGVKQIGSNAFSSCINNAQIKIPASVTHIGENAFSNDKTSIVRALYIDDIDSYSQIQFDDVSSSPMSWCNKLYISNNATTSITISDSVQKISAYAFYNASVIKELTLPNSLIEIGESAFAGTAVKELKTDSECKIGQNAFGDCHQLSVVDIKCRGDIEDSTFSSCPSLLNVSIKNCTAINSNAFTNSFMTPGASLVIIGKEGSNCDIGSRAFENATGLVSVNLEGRFDYINQFTFKGCTALETITIPLGVSVIDNQAFCYCSSLDNVVIPSSVDTIGMFAFYNCSNIKNLVLEEGVRIIGFYAFCGCCGLQEVTIPDSIAEIGDGAFMYSMDSDVDTGMEAPSTRAGYIFDNWYSDPEFHNVVDFDNIHDATNTSLASESYSSRGKLTLKAGGAGTTIYSKWNKKIVRKTNPMIVNARPVRIKYSTLRRRTVKVKRTKAFTIKSRKGTLSFKLKKRDPKAKSKITISKAGVIKVKKGLKKGRYKIRVAVRAAGNKYYKPKTKYVYVTIRVKR